MSCVRGAGKLVGSATALRTPRIRGDMAESQADSDPKLDSSTPWTGSIESPGAAGLVEAMGREGVQRAVGFTVVNAVLMVVAIALASCDGDRLPQVRMSHFPYLG